MTEERFTEMDLQEKYFRLEHLMHRYFAERRRKKGPLSNPHRGQGRILKILSMKPEISQRELSYLLDMRPQSVGELLGKLEKNGFITRTPNPEDRRIQMIELTEAGRNAANEEEEKTDDKSIFQQLTPEEVESLDGLLNKLIQLVSAEIPDDEKLEPHHHDHRREMRDHRPRRHHRDHFRDADAKGF